ncbi:MAG: carboxypeptidase-like regulatory domain-containing protein [Acidobacteriota bacterium]
MRTPLRLAATAIVILLTAPTVEAQVKGMGRIHGVVVSDAGAPVDGVSIKAPLMSGGVIEGRSSDGGSFYLAGVGRGEWQVEFEKAGFETKRVRIIVQKETMNPEQIKVVLRKAS